MSTVSTQGAVVTLGRICEQKDPTYFADAAMAYRGDRQWVWIGGVSEDDKKAQHWLRILMAAGVHVTGWKDRGVAMALLTQAHVYVHTAAWEGFPVTILEAAVRGLPIIARDIPAVAHEGIEPLCTSPAHMAGWVKVMDDEYQWRRACVRSLEWVMRRQVQESQRAALIEAYGLTDELPARPS